MSKALRYVAGVVLIIIGIYYNPALIAQGVALIVGTALEKTPRKLRRLLEQTVMVRSAVAPQEVVYGTTRKSGVVAWYDANGTSNKYLWFVIAVCEHEINGFNALWIDNVRVDLNTDITWENEPTSGYVDTAAFVDSDGNKLVKCGFYLGTSSQIADPDLVASSVYWTSAHTGKDVCYFWVRCEIDASKGGTDPESPAQNVWAKGWPRDLSVEIEGKKIYDPRLDSTQIIDSTTSPVTYGSGSHDLTNEASWTFSNNSVLVRADYIKDSRFGPGYDYTDIDWETVAKEADKADTLVPYPDGTSPSPTHKQWTIDGIVSTDDQPKLILEALQSADHGTTLFLPDGIKIYTGAWRAPTVTIDESWLAGSYSATSATPADNNYNAVRGQYLDADQNWTLVGFQPITSSAYETEDGTGTKWTDIALSYTTNEYRAQRIALIELKKSRLQTSISVECGPIAEQVEIHDIVYVDLPGFSSADSPSGVITARVIGKQTTTGGVTTLSLRQESESDWTYDVADMAIPPSVTEVTRGSELIPAPSGLVANTAVNGILVEWTEPVTGSPEVKDLTYVDYYELWGATTNNRATADLLTRTTSLSYLHWLTTGTVRYYWVRSRSNFGFNSTFYPSSATGGVQGTAGEEGADATLYYIKPINGTAIQNSTGTLTLEGHIVTGASDTILSAGDIKLQVSNGASPEVWTTVTEANGYAVPSDGYTGSFDSGDINGNVVVALRDTVGGTVYDTITLVDVADGGDSVYGYIEPDQSLVWVRDVDQATWTPTDTTCQLDCTFVQGGSEVARIAHVITRGPDGILTGAPGTHTGGDLNTSRVTVTEIGESSRSMTVEFSYSFGGDTGGVSETVSSVLGGEAGITAYLDHVPMVVFTDIEGFNYTLDINSPTYSGTVTLADKNGVFRVFQGDTELTGTINDMYEQDTGDGWTADFSRQAKTQNGLTMTISKDDGTYELRVTSGATGYRAWTSQSFSTNIRVLVGGVYYTQKFTAFKTYGSKSLSVAARTKPNSQVDGPGDSGQTASQYKAAAGFKFDNDGNIYKRTVTTSPTWTDTGYDWLLSGTNSEYEIRATLKSGDTPDEGTMDTWQVLSTDRSWSVFVDGSVSPVYRGDKTSVITIEIRRASSNEVLVEEDFSMSVTDDWTAA